MTHKRTVGGVVFGRNNRVTECGTVGYCINRKAANIILNINQPFWLTDDWSLFIKLGIKVYHPKNPLIYEDLSSESTTRNVEYSFVPSYPQSPMKLIVESIFLTSS